MLPTREREAAMICRPSLASAMVGSGSAGYMTEQVSAENRSALGVEERALSLGGSMDRVFLPAMLGVDFSRQPIESSPGSEGTKLFASNGLHWNELRLQARADAYGERRTTTTDCALNDERLLPGLIADCLARNAERWRQVRKNSPTPSWSNSSRRVP